MRKTILLSILLVGCGGGGGGGSSPPPPEPAPPPPPPAPPPDEPADPTLVDGIWITSAGADEPAQLFMHAGFVIASTSGEWPSDTMAAGVFQVNGEAFTGQFTSRHSGFPYSGFSGTLHGNHLDFEFTGADLILLFSRTRDSITLDEVVRVWNQQPAEETLTIYSDGTLAFQDVDGCAASGSVSVDDMDLLSLSFDMQGCPDADRNGAYRGIGYSRGHESQSGQTLWIAAANDTNTGQFLSWLLVPN